MTIGVGEGGYEVQGRPRAGRWAGIAIVALCVVVGLVALAGLTGCRRASSDSGIAGTVTIGPVQPVATAGTPDSRPYAAELVIEPKSGLHLKRPLKVTSAADGSFRVNLEPGTYLIGPDTPGSMPSLSPIEVVVLPHKFTTVDVVFDSGIR